MNITGSSKICYSQNSLASNTTTRRDSLAANFAKWYAVETPDIPEPMMQMSASADNSPSLPSREEGETFDFSSQNERVGLATGRFPLRFFVVLSANAFCVSASVLNDTGKEAIENRQWSELLVRSQALRYQDMTI